MVALILCIAVAANIASSFSPVLERSFLVFILFSSLYNIAALIVFILMILCLNRKLPYLPLLSDLVLTSLGFPDGNSFKGKRKGKD